MTHSYTWLASFIYITHIHMCRMWYVYERVIHESMHDTSRYVFDVTRPVIHTHTHTQSCDRHPSFDMPRSYTYHIPCVWHDSFIHTPWLIHIHALHDSYTCYDAWHDSSIYVTRLVHVYDMTPSYIYHVHALLVCTCYVSHLYTCHDAWHDSSIYVTRLVGVCDMTRWYIRASHLHSSRVWCVSTSYVIHLVRGVCMNESVYVIHMLCAMCTNKSHHKNGM